MAFRSHVMRSLDLSVVSNRLVIGLVGVAAIGSLAMILTGGSTDLWLAPIYLFISWALVRELDPDHQSTALISGIASALWVFAGYDSSAWFAGIGLLLAARLISNSTGRRPLVTDAIGVGVLGVVISFSVAGWVAGFGVALAIYIDDRMADTHHTYSVIVAALTGLGASVVATAAMVFPQEVPDIRPFVAIGMGLLALVAVIREPEAPYSLVDSRMKNPLNPSRLHAARGLVGILVFIAAMLSGPESSAMQPSWSRTVRFP